MVRDLGLQRYTTYNHNSQRDLTFKLMETRMSRHNVGTLPLRIEMAIVCRAELRSTAAARG